MPDNYFQCAKDWKYDRYEMQLVRGNRWQVAFALQTIFSGFLVIALIILMPLKTITPVVIHQNQQTGAIWVDQPTKRAIPNDQTAIESDLVRYVINRETFSTIDFKQRFREVILKTTVNLVHDYQYEQSIKNPKSLVNVLGVQGIRTVKIEDVIFIEKASHNKKSSMKQSKNLAKIDFTTTDETNKGTVKKSWVATIGWEYRGTPDQKEMAWENWNGFIVTYYRVDQRNI